MEKITERNPAPTSGPSGLNQLPTSSPKSKLDTKSLETSASPSSPVEISVSEVKNRSDVKEFLALPKQIYGRYPKYVQPLNLHMKMMMGKIESPNKRFFLARVNGQAVARLGVKVHEHAGKKTLNFGFFECLEGHQEAVRKLFCEAQKIAPDLKMMGPFHFRMEDPYIGVLVEGYERDPYFLMSYNPPYYDDYLRLAGLTTLMDLFTYQIDDPNALTPVIYENASKAKEAGVTIRTLDMKNLWKEATTIARIFNDALSKNWGFEEFLQDQVKEMVQLFRLFIDPRVVALAQKDNKDVGCLIMIPNYNPILKGSKGKITPKVIWKYFRRRSLINTFRGYALGVLRDYHSYGIGSALTKEMFDLGVKAGYVQCEISWVLANNGPMNELSKAMGGKHNKVYRIYERSPKTN